MYGKAVSRLELLLPVQADPEAQGDRGNPLLELLGQLRPATRYEDVDHGDVEGVAPHGQVGLGPCLHDPHADSLSTEDPSQGAARHGIGLDQEDRSTRHAIKQASAVPRPNPFVFSA